MTVKQVLRYVKGTINLEICILSQSSLNLYGFYDADWAGCPDMVSCFLVPIVSSGMRKSNVPLLIQLPRLNTNLWQSSLRN